MKAPRGSADEYDLSITLPAGYFELPLDNIDERLDAAAPFVELFSSETPTETVSEVLGTLKFLLTALVAGNTRYCGLGQHLSETGERIASWLVVSLMTYGNPQNPRLTLLDIATAKNLDNASLVIEPVDVEGRPILFAECIRTLPQPEITDVASQSVPASVFQMEAFVPSEDGTTVASIEFSTTSLSEGPKFREMFFMLAASTQIGRAAGRPSMLDM